MNLPVCWPESSQETCSASSKRVWPRVGNRTDPAGTSADESRRQEGRMSRTAAWLPQTAQNRGKPTHH